MPHADWKDELNKYFENVRIIEKCKGETLAHFDQFREFIAEPALESLSDALKERGIRTRYKKSRGRLIHFEICFPQTKIGQFHYGIELPKNSVELRPNLRVKSRKGRRAPFQETVEVFMRDLAPAAIMKLSKEELILDILERYKEFIYRALTSPD